MEERMVRHFNKEEEFLDKFEDTAFAAASILNDEWRLSFYTDDESRRSIAYFFSTGQLDSLVFDSASVYHDNNGFSSVQIVLKSSKRIVNVKVKKISDKLVAEKIIDRPNN